jgi:hypothetical protein
MGGAGGKPRGNPGGGGKGASVVSPRPEVSRPQAVLVRGGWSGDFRWRDLGGRFGSSPAGLVRCGGWL